MTDLSPAAQAALDAGMECSGPAFEPLVRKMIAAALRAAAGYMFPNDTAQQCYDRILAIADELEAHGTMP